MINDCMTEVDDWTNIFNWLYMLITDQLKRHKIEY